MRSTCGSERVRVWPDGTQRGYRTPQSQQGPYEAVNLSLVSTHGPLRRECCPSALDYASMTAVILSTESLPWGYPSCPRMVALQAVNSQMKKKIYPKEAVQVSACPSQEDSESLSLRRWAHPGRHFSNPEVTRSPHQVPGVERGLESLSTHCWQMPQVGFLFLGWGL